MLRIPLNASTFGDEEINGACETLKTGFVTMGAKCEQFEDDFARYFGVRNAIFVNSGSSANLLAFFALANPALSITGRKRRMQPGDEVIVPAVTWSTTVWPVVQAGGVPVVVDCDPETLQMNIEAVQAAITPKTVAICPVHVLGNAVTMKPILDLAREHGLWVIEDTCEALGTRHDGMWVGTMGDIGTYSFFFSHHITTIEGGMIVTNDDDLAELFRSLRAHGWTRHLKNRKSVEAKYPDLDPRFLFVTTGFNVRPTEINAVFGIHQLKKLARFNKRRDEIAAQWHTALAPLKEKKLLTPMQATPGTECTWFGFPVLCRDGKTRDNLKEHLEKNGVETRPIICGNLVRQPAFQHVKHRVVGKLSGADRVMDTGLFWGSHPTMTDEEVLYVSKLVRNFFG